MEPVIYLDNHATTRCDPRVVEAMLPFFSDTYGNPSSRSHAIGQRAADATEDARLRIASAIGAEAREIVITSGATESNRLAIEAAVARGRRRRLVSAFEHKSMLELPGPVGTFPVGRDGIVDPAAARAALTRDDALLSVMTANSEIGTLQPVGAIAAVARDAGVPFHTDATAALGRVPVDVRESGADFVSFTAHKLYGPKGVGALFVRGGSGFSVSRPGTANVAGAVGFAVAIELCAAELAAEARRLQALRGRLLAGLVERVGGISVNGDLERRLPGNLNVSVAGIDGPSLVPSLRGIAVSSGSACSTGGAAASHMLLAIGRSRAEALSALRFCIGRFNTEAEIDRAVEIVAQAVAKLRAVASFQTRAP